MPWTTRIQQGLKERGGIRGKMQAQRRRICRKVCETANGKEGLCTGGTGELSFDATCEADP